MTHEVAVAPLPAWLDARRWLGPGTWRLDAGRWTSRLETVAAADLAARARGVVLDGYPVEVRVHPPLRRPAVRAARTDEARRHRMTTAASTRAGLQLDEVGRLGWSPEALAFAHARTFAPTTVLDATTGCGGDAIAFALAGCRVIATDTHPGRLAMARANAVLYGVADAITFHRMDAAAAIAAFPAPLVHLDPPWDALDPLPTWIAAVPPSAIVTVKLPAATATAAWPDFRWTAVFGEGEGDRRRVKWLRGVRSPAPPHPPRPPPRPLS